MAQDKNESKASKFSRLATARVNNAIKRIQTIGNLANRASYEYKDAQIDKLFSALELAVSSAKSKFLANKVDSQRVEL